MTVAYRLTFSSSASIHPVFYVSELKQALSNITPIEPTTPHFIEELNGKLSPRMSLPTTSMIVRE